MAQSDVITEFTHQAETFNTSAVARSEPVLDALVEAAGPDAGERWLEVACGPGLVARRLAPLVGSVHGVDVTAAMIEVARREAAGAGATNATFELGDATSLALPAASFDGAITRFSLHHIPAPGRVLSELARIVRPGGAIVVADHLADEGAAAFAWSQEIERLRDPSHWASLPVGRLRALGDRYDVALESERVIELELDYEDWLTRGSGGEAARDVIEGLVDEPPDGADCFTVARRDDRRVLRLRMWVGRWRR